MSSRFTDALLQAAIDTKVSKSGDTMSGVLSMGNNKIIDVADGVNTETPGKQGQLDAGRIAQHISQFTADDLTEGSNLYYTDAHLRVPFSVTDVDGEGNGYLAITFRCSSVSTGKAFVELEDVSETSPNTRQGTMLHVYVQTVLQSNLLIQQNYGSTTTNSDNQW